MADTLVSPERKTLTVEEAAAALGIGRTSAYELARRGELPGVIRLGRRFVVSRDVLERLLSGADVATGGPSVAASGAVETRP